MRLNFLKLYSFTFYFFFFFLSLDYVDQKPHLHMIVKKKNSKTLKKTVDLYF